MENLAGDLVSFSADSKDVLAEVIRRGAKVGHCTKHGECPRATRIQDLCAWGRTKLNVWPRDENGNLID